jgi:hypothetical protein
MKENAQYLQNLAIARLQAMPPNVRIHVGGHGSFSQAELISEIRNGSDIGKEAVEVQIEMIRTLPRFALALAKENP